MREINSSGENLQALILARNKASEMKVSLRSVKEEFRLGNIVMQNSYLLFMLFVCWGNLKCLMCIAFN